MPQYIETKINQKKDWTKIFNNRRYFSHREKKVWTI